MTSDETTETIRTGKPKSQDVVKKERNVTNSLLRHFLKYYGVEDAREIQEMCEEGTGAR